MSKYAVVYDAPETVGSNWCAHVPDLPGCYAVGDTREECEADASTAIAAHLDALRRFGKPIPAPTTYAGMVEAA